MKINVFIFGLPYDEETEDEEGMTGEEAAMAECNNEFGTTKNCLVIDTLGTVLLNTTGIELERVVSS